MTTQTPPAYRVHWKHHVLHSAWGIAVFCLGIAAAAMVCFSAKSADPAGVVEIGNPCTNFLTISNMVYVRMGG